jgi:pimeloyl-ACP methyl ester carboxylesterase
MVWHVWGNGPPVVLLHGGSGSWTHWARNIDVLVDSGRQVLVPDLPGFGDSASPPVGHDADALPPWLEVGLHQLLGGQPVDLVGFSFGGLVAGLVAARRRQPGQRQVLVGAPARDDQPNGRIVLRAWQAEPPGPAREAVHRHNLERLMLANPSSVDALALRIHDDNLQRDRMRQRRLQATDLLLRTLPTISCPVAGIWGAEDALYRGRPDVVEHALGQAPSFESLLFIPHAGHWVQYENAPAFNAVLALALR